jgi:hypothetical protein
MDGGRGHEGIEEHPSDVQWPSELEGAGKHLQPEKGISDHEDHWSRD